MRTGLLALLLVAVAACAAPPPSTSPSSSTAALPELPEDKGGEVLARYRGTYAHGELTVERIESGDGRAVQALTADESQTSETRVETESATPRTSTVLLRRYAAPTIDANCNVASGGFGASGIPNPFRGVCWDMTLVNGFADTDVIRPYVQLDSLTYTGGVPFGTVTAYNRSPTDTEIGVSNTYGLWSYATLRSAGTSAATQHAFWYFYTPESGSLTSFSWVANVKGRRVSRTVRMQTVPPLSPATLCAPDPGQRAAISTDGNVVAWVTADPTCCIGACPSNAHRQVMLYRRDLDIMQMASRAYSTSDAWHASNGDNFNITMDEDGKFIAWESTATNLFRTDFGDYKGNLEANGANSDIIIADARSVSYRWFAVWSSATRSNIPGVNCHNPHFSPDGNTLGFETDGALDYSDFNYNTDVYLVRFLGPPSGSNLTGGTEEIYWLASPDNGARVYDAHLLGVSGTAYASSSYRTAFISYDPQFTGDFTNVHFNVFTNDYVAASHAMASGTLRRMTLTNTGAVPNADAVDGDIDPTGAYVAFSSVATNMVGTTTTGRRHVYYRGVTAAASTVVRVDQSLSNGEPNGNSWNPSIDRGGRIVTYASLANNMIGYPVGYTPNGLSQLFQADMRSTDARRYLRSAIVSTSVSAFESGAAVELFGVRSGTDVVVFPAASGAMGLDTSLCGGLACPSSSYVYLAPSF